MRLKTLQNVVQHIEFFLRVGNEKIFQNVIQHIEFSHRILCVVQHIANIAKHQSAHGILTSNTLRTSAHRIHCKTSLYVCMCACMCVYTLQNVILHIEFSHQIHCVLQHIEYIAKRLCMCVCLRACVCIHCKMSFCTSNSHVKYIAYFSTSSTLQNVFVCVYVCVHVCVYIAKCHSAHRIQHIEFVLRCGSETHGACAHACMYVCVCVCVYIYVCV